jgi:hypothetical protein
MYLSLPDLSRFGGAFLLKMIARKENKYEFTKGNFNLKFQTVDYDK